MKTRDKNSINIEEWREEWRVKIEKSLVEAHKLKIKKRNQILKDKNN